MNNIFRCPSCNELIKGFTPDKCESCGYQIKEIDGVFIFTQKGNVEINNDNKYIGFDVIAPNYDLTRGRFQDSKEGEIVGKLLGPDKIILEIGAGTGYHSISIAKAGCSVIAGDISVNMLKVLVSKMTDSLKENLIPCKFDAYLLPLGDMSVDAVFIDHVFHLIANPEKVLKEIKRVLKPNGYFINIIYIGDTLSTDEEVKRYRELTSKIDVYYESAVEKNGMRLLERFGWSGHKLQQDNFDRFFQSFKLIEDDSLTKKQTETIKDYLKNYRDLVLVNQAEIDREINNRIIDEIEEKLTSEYGNGYADIRLDTIEKTAIQIFKSI